jgi:dihydroorotate dehydrogenase electron transfer subunit
VQVEVPGPFALRRPFSVAGAPEDGVVELLIETRGDATRRLTALAEGTEIALSGPLGRPFDPHPEGATAVLVAGGIGVAGLRLLAYELAAAGAGFVALIGARDTGRLLDGTLPDLPGTGPVRVECSTDDGSRGTCGTVCDLFRAIADELPASCHVYLCGPRAMIDDAGCAALERGYGASALLEETMACGVGACRGCVVETRHGYRTACSDGPVFNVADLIPERGPDG